MDTKYKKSYFPINLIVKAQGLLSEQLSAHTLSELTNILYLLALVILTLFSLVDTITEGS